MPLRSSWVASPMERARFGSFLGPNSISNARRRRTSSAPCPAEAQTLLALRDTDDLTWIDLLDPDAAALAAAMPGEVHPSAFERLQAPPRHDDEPRPRLETHGNHLFGVLVVPQFVAEEV